MLQKIVNPLLALAMYYFPEVEARQADRRTREFISLLFKVDNTIRCNRTGELFTILEVDCGGALIGNHRTVARVDWVLGCGKLRHNILQQWSLREASQESSLILAITPSL